MAARRRKRGRVKTGNIFLLLLLIAGAVAFFNKESILEELRNNGLLKERGAVSSTTDELPSAGDVPTGERKDDNSNRNGSSPYGQVDNAITEDQNSSNSVSAETPNWSLQTAFTDYLVLRQENFLQIKVDGMEVADITPVIDGKGAVIKAVNKATGEYTVYPIKEERVELSLMFLNKDKKLDILGSKVFEVRKAADLRDLSQYKESNGYLWELETQHSDTLYTDKANWIRVNIAETPASAISVSISGKGNTIKTSSNDSSAYEVFVNEALKNISLTVFVTNQSGERTLVGSQLFVVAKKKGVSGNNNTPNVGMPVFVPSALWNKLLYVGVTNPFYTPNISSNWEVKVDNGAVIRKKDSLLLQPDKLGKLKLSLFNEKNTLIQQQQFMVQELPLPAIRLGNLTEKEISVADLDKINRITVADNKLGQAYEIQDFAFSYFSPMQSVIDVANNGAILSNEVRAVLGSAKAPAVIYFSNINIKNTQTGQLQQLDALVYRLVP